MKLYCGSAFPLENGGYVVTLVCPNAGSYERLKIELAGINPDAYGPAIAARETGNATGGGASSQSMIFGSDAPELTPAQKALRDLGDEEAPTAYLKAGEAVIPPANGSVGN